MISPLMDHQYGDDDRFVVGNHLHVVFQVRLLVFPCIVIASRFLDLTLSRVDAVG